MKRCILSALFGFAVFFSFAQTQTEMSEEAFKDYQKSDKKLNTVYQTILQEYRSDTLFIKNLKTAQKIWVQFRDAEMKAKYPDGEAGYVGSARPMCWYNYMADLTADRTKQLNVWLTKTTEGDVCAGSVQPKH